MLLLLMLCLLLLPLTMFTMSVDSLKSVFVVDEMMVTTLKRHLVALHQQRIIIQQYLDEDRAMNNPLLSFQVFRRIIIDRNQISSNIITISSELASAVDTQNESWLKYEEMLIEVGQSILRLQNTYQIQSEQLVIGIIKHIHTPATFTITDCLILASLADNAGQQHGLVEWSQRAQLQCQDKSEPRGTCKLHCGMSTLKPDQVRQVTKTAANGLEIPLCSLQTLGLSPNVIRHKIQPYTESPICSNGNQSMEHVSKLRCYYMLRPDDVYVTLQRYRAEERSADPPVITIYDVISDLEADEMIRIAKPKLCKSKVFNREAENKARISQTGWLFDAEHPVIQSISRRIGSITGYKVNINTTEPFQVVNYGIGGMYGVHYDLLTNSNVPGYQDWPMYDDRLLTFLIYLNDVELGGATVFPHSAVSIPVTKRAATLWFNYDVNGNIEINSLHAGCSVIMGTKWIANKWIHMRYQTSMMQCPRCKNDEQLAINNRLGKPPY